MSDELRGWTVLKPGAQDELMERTLELLTSCEHEWSDWQWEPGTAAYRGGFAKECLRCHIWLYDLAVNAGLDGRP